MEGALRWAPEFISSRRRHSADESDEFVGSSARILLAAHSTGARRGADRASINSSHSNCAHALRAVANSCALERRQPTTEPMSSLSRVSRARQTESREPRAQS